MACGGEMKKNLIAILLSLLKLSVLEPETAY